MWSKKKPDTTQAADPEPTNLQTNQPPKPSTASSEGTTKMSKDVLRPAGGTADLASSRLGSSLHLKGEHLVSGIGRFACFPARLPQLRILISTDAFSAGASTKSGSDVFAQRLGLRNSTYCLSAYALCPPYEASIRGCMENRGLFLSPHRGRYSKSEQLPHPRASSLVTPRPTAYRADRVLRESCFCLADPGRRKI